MKLRKVANRRGFTLSCECCFSQIGPGQRYWVDEVTRQTFCKVECGQKLDRELNAMGLPRFDPTQAVTA